MDDFALANVFNSTSADFNRLTPTVWGPASHALIHQLSINPGERILDVCSGTGASALAAAMAVGPTGHVDAVDLAGELLAVGAKNAQQRGLHNIKFHTADIASWDSTAPLYDALACSYGVFFLPDMDAAVGGMVKRVRKGGRVGLTVWRRGAMEEFATVFGDIVRRFANDNEPARKPPWADAIRRIDEPESLRNWLATVGVYDSEVRTLSNLIPMTEAFAWDMVLGSGMRGAVMGFDAQTATQFKGAFIAELHARGVTTVDATTLVATGVV
ncbi:class I SAM-dependent methyltransferase [Hoyosella rhizosphaerae]|uniref:Methyltransferase domain-containing protein n=1 Tax=Hoyosella rhizosphaerae TaxID=1755582 RepID=A0A916UG97_9ACTN|nr:class I SAM-dependent methyltransferase [Hoyosella rhizosphaerae]MBN4928113.1 class I SAM-dependent methyltransferase [Hoyosella rhizosphaerae]GGC72482.1 hypothetical protein GCM10011410_26940 [Hoyosella rhizosphaerae]